MKKAAIIGSPALHLNYKTALEKVSCQAVIFPDASYIKRHPEAFDGLLLPGGGDVPASLSDYSSLSGTSPACGCNPPDFFSPSAIRDPGGSDRPAGSSALLFHKDSAASSSDYRIDLEQLEALDLFYRRNKPVFGICKGMQLINLYFGGTIRYVNNRNLHRHPGRDAFHPADNQPGSFLHALFGLHMLVNSNHHQCINVTGQNLQVIQHSPDGEAEAVSHLSAPVFGTQWHPERMPKYGRQDAILLFRYFISLL